MTVHDVVAWLEEFAPLHLAEEWDNVGLLLGDTRRSLSRVMTCLTLTADVADEATRENVDLIVSHHPILFRPVQRLTTGTREGELLLKLIAAGVSVYSPHTAFDSAADGINAELSRLFELSDVQPLRPMAAPEAGNDDELPAGSGRFGRLPEGTDLTGFMQVVKEKLGVPHLQFVGDPARRIEQVGIACGSAAEFLRDAAGHGCDVLLTGEARFHACLEARDLEIAMVLPGHYASERPAVEGLADRIGQQFSDLEVWPSRVESDPVQWSVS
ncbi:Putative GTP cyclohydrolase 1 type 2 [Maioricimonas rarisocia]|uniref:GTP cyclohydrolase 1 type 2 homolog n=1 Tax=Maioricimonas rarisocia TaxID=2528026 RepID=A0A517Z7M9_9PLAN|nr:Nif3-like dinuclear metal center hexameric protein [Maioricimonas rarisocia]QDU38472.1 Putative GTP cyclohydrolase 1 type 2 [Maioricimonas rarisocia]